MAIDVMVEAALDATPLSSLQFTRISRMVHERCGICLPEGKEVLVKSRLTKRLRHLGLTNFSEYMKYLDEDPSQSEFVAMIDALTTNKTYFFREPQHFEFIRSRLLPGFRNSQANIRFWSAGCSTGDEPFSLAILLREELPEARLRQCQILATDISFRVLATARAAVYGKEAVQTVEPQLLKRHLTCLQKNPEPLYQISDDVRAMVRFALLNLADRWPMKGPFDAIFCRNVMIYFDKETRKKLVRRFWELLKPGGYLFVGHSESLVASSREFHYVQPAIYQK
jgi:chemotaxis protein methyltransferase CheR